MIDADNNNQISLAELERAEQILADQILRLRVPNRRTRCQRLKRATLSPGHPAAPQPRSPSAGLDSSIILTDAHAASFHAEPSPTRHPLAQTIASSEEGVFFALRIISKSTEGCR